MNACQPLSHSRPAPSYDVADADPPKLGQQAQNGGSVGTPIETSASVHPLQTSEPHPGLHLTPPTAGAPGYANTVSASVLEQTARHQRWAWRRWKVWQALQQTNQPTARRDRFASCGSGLTLQQRGDELVLTCFACNDRFCEVCQEAKRRQLRDQIEVICQDHAADIRFFTFTLRHSPTPLADQTKRLRHCLKLLHRRKFWQATQRGGIDCIEAKPSKQRDGWHVHAHCIVEGSWIDQKELAAEWHAITGDSSVVDVQRKGTAAEMARYATKYATKPLHEETYLLRDHLQEAICAMKGSRLVNCWGTWHGIDREDEDSPPELRPIGTIRELVAASIEGDPGARLYLQLACVRWPELERAVPLAAVAPLPPPEPNATPPPAPPMDPRWNQVEVLPF